MTEPSLSDQTRPARRDGVPDKSDLASLSGLEFLSRILRGELPGAPICEALAFDIALVEPGRVMFEGRPDERHFNPLGTVHGGYASTLLDSCMACAVHSLLEAGVGYTTMELKVSLVRPILGGIGSVRAIGTVLNRGRRAAYAEGRLLDSRDRLLAHGTTTCLLFPLDSGGAG